MNILFLSQWFPYPANNGSKLRIFNLLRILAAHHDVTLLAFADQPDVDPTAPELAALCDDVQVVAWRPFNPQSRRARLGFLSAVPRSVIDTHSPEMQQAIERCLARADFDVVVASQWMMAGYSRAFESVPALFEEAEVGLFFQQFAAATSLRDRVRFGLSWSKHRLYLARLLHDFAACTVVSGHEQRLVSNIAPASTPVDVIPNCINLADYGAGSMNARANSLIFCGSFHYYANHEAMVWFVEQVFPLILARVPETRLTITGDHAKKPLPACENVDLVGYVDDIQSLVASSTVSIAPLLVGGGTRLKVLEAMALRTPVVATSKGAEGLAAQDGESILIADTPSAFADAVIRLICQPALRERVAANAHALVSETYDWPVVAPRFLGLVDRVAAARSCW